MRIVEGFVLQELQPFEINREFDRHRKVINGFVGFGEIDGRDRNIDGQLVDVTFTLAATEQAVPHTLGTIPSGYIVLSSSNGGVIYDGTTANTTTDLYLQSTTANHTVRLFIAR